MSIQAIAQVLDLEDPRLDASCKMVLIGLANHTSTTGQCFPSVRLLMRYSCMAERTVRGVIKKLEEEGFIRVERRDGHSSIYYLTLTPADIAETPAPAAPTPAADAPPTPAAAAPITVTIKPEQSASDARDLIDEGWKPSPAVREAIDKLYPSIDIDDQITAFILKSRSNRTIHKDPDEAFKAWMHRAKDLKLPPKARTPAARPAPMDPAAVAARLELDAKTREVMGNKDEASETMLEAATLYLRIGNVDQARSCGASAKAMARRDSWHFEQAAAFLKELDDGT